MAEDLAEDLAGVLAEAEAVVDLAAGGNRTQKIKFERNKICQEVMVQARMARDLEQVAAEVEAKYKAEAEWEVLLQQDQVATVYAPIAEQQPRMLLDSLVM